jgi:hypothetical protein
MPEQTNMLLELDHAMNGVKWVTHIAIFSSPNFKLSEESSFQPTGVLFIKIMLFLQP